MPHNVMERIPLGDGTFAQFEKPMTYKVPEKIEYIEHQDKAVFMPKEGELFLNKEWFKEYQSNTINKIIHFDPYLAIKHCRDVILEGAGDDKDELMWNVDRLYQLEFTQLLDVYTLINNANTIGLTNPNLL